MNCYKVFFLLISSALWVLFLHKGFPKGDFMQG